MSEQPLSLTPEERSCVATLLELTLKEARIEEHRTRTPTYRAEILHREQVLEGILAKLQKGS